MALSVYTNYFTIDSTDSGTIEITGVGFRPKLVLFFNTDGSGFPSTQNDAEFSFGAMTVDDEYCSTHCSEDAQSTSDDSKTLRNVAIYSLLTSSGALDFQYSYNSMTDDGFILNVDDVPSNARSIIFICFGGSSLSNVKVGTFNTGTSSQSRSVTGAGFQGNFLMALGSSTAVGSTVDGYDPCIGFATASAQGYVAGYDEHGVATTNSSCRIDNDRFIARLTGSGADGAASFTSFDSDGFTYYTDNAFSQDTYFIYVLMQIDEVYIGEFPLRASTGNFSETGFGLQPKFFMMMSPYNSDKNTQADSQFFLGFTDGTRQFHIGNFCEDGLGTTNTYKRRNNNEVIDIRDNTEATVSEASFVSFDPDGITLNQEEAGAAYDVLCLAFGESEETTLYERAVGRGVYRGVSRGVM